MGQLVDKLFRIRPEERGLVLTLSAILFCNSVAQQIAGIVSVSGFLSTGSANGVLVVWVIDMLVILLITALQSLIVDRFSRVALMRWMLFAFALVYVVLRLMFTFRVTEQVIYAVMFVLADVQWIVFPLIFWILANDLSDMAQAKRIFPPISSASFVGKLAGIGVAMASPAIFTHFAIKPEEVLTVNILIYMLAYLIVEIGLRNARVRQVKQKEETTWETLTEGWNFIKEVPSFRYLTLTVLAISVCLTITEFRFLTVTKATFTTHDVYQQFYSLYRLALTVASLVLQSLLTSRIIQKIELKNAFLILPSTLFAGAIWMLAQTGIISAVGAMFIPKLVQKTVDESAVSTFQALVPEERRGRVRAFIGSYPPAIGTILGALITGAIILIGARLQTENYVYAYLAVAVLTAGLGVAAALKMRAVYDTSLLNWRMKRRQRASSLASKLDF